jgi:hypothetical protein
MTDCHRCDCHGPAARRAAAGAPPATIWSAIVPILACALCPACLPLYANLLAALGLGFAMTEGEHHVLLAAAVIVAVGYGAWRALRTHRILPFAVSAGGCGLMVAGHALGEVGFLSWLGVAVLLAGGWVERRHGRR